jgi:DNA-binding CsgD family transcriptional regulator
LASDALADVSPECRHMLNVAAAIGPTFTVSDVAELLQRPVATLLPAVSEAIDLDLCDSKGTALAFHDTAVWRAVVAGIPGPVLSCLRREIAELAGHRGGEPADPSDRPSDGEAEPACPGWASLTDAERTIARLVGAGLTNRQVSAKVYRSPHTVNYHLRQIFRKLNIRSRVELARLTVQHKN